MTVCQHSFARMTSTYIQCLSHTFSYIWLLHTFTTPDIHYSNQWEAVILASTSSSRILSYLPSTLKHDLEPNKVSLLLLLRIFLTETPEEAWPFRPSNSSDLEWFRVSDGKKAILNLTGPVWGMQYERCVQQREQPILCSSSWASLATEAVCSRASRYSSELGIH
jgi:hypothetical protein